VSLRRTRVLVADDHPAMMKATCRLLSVECEVVASVADGGALLEAVPRLQPDVIVLDVNLPGVDGLEVCRRITQSNPDIKVIIFTAMSEQEVGEQSFDAGASAFVSKLAAGGLLSAIKRLRVGQGSV
jgi:CheY-like chemotaxis protein